MHKLFTLADSCLLIEMSFMLGAHTFMQRPTTSILKKLRPRSDDDWHRRGGLLGFVFAGELWLVEEGS